MAVVYAVAANKGGVGKTSFVTNIAAAITQKNKKARVLIVDIDAQGNAALAFGKSPKKFENTIYDVLADGASIESVKVQLTKQIDLVPANKEMDFIEFDILTNLDKYNKIFHLLKKPLDVVRDQYDYVFIDSPPSLGLVAGNVLVAADRVIIPFAPETFAVFGIERVIEAITDFKKEHNPELKIDGVVGMLVDSRTVLHSEMLAQARKYCVSNGYHMYETVIPRTVRFASATAYDSQPAVLADSDKLVTTYFELLKEVLERGKEKS